MQIIRTEVARSTTQIGDPVLRMLLGEGGDRVVVDMAKVEARNDEDTLTYARAILIQTGGLEGKKLHENGDDVVQSYVYEYWDGHKSQQVPPSRMATTEAAREGTVRCAVELLDDMKAGTGDRAEWLVRVSDENGELLYIIAVQEAERARQLIQ